MKIRQFLEHHGIAENPFADEDAQTDLIFKGHCILNTFHPTWDKILGNPADPSTAIVFGEKGSGKTALRLQLGRHLADFNADHPRSRVFVVQYDDFNPFLDRLRERFSGRRRQANRVLGQWKLWDHMDAILALAVTQLVDRILEVSHADHPAAVDTEPLAVGSLEASQVRDIMLLASCYDQSTGENREDRWNRLRRKVKFSTWRSKWDLALGSFVTALVVGLFLYFGGLGGLFTVWPFLLIAAGWMPWLIRLMKWAWRARSIVKNTRVLTQNAGAIRRMFMRFTGRQIVDQPLPTFRRTDDRYELLAKLQNTLKSLDFAGIVVLVDRLDEPYLINGSTDLMQAMLWPMLDNKFLKHPGMGFKLLLPQELVYQIDREGREFHQRARLDKQNLIRSLEWTGESLSDMTDARLKACAMEGRTPCLSDLLDESIDRRRLLDAMRSLRVPRHLFKFLYRLFVTHTNTHTDDEPVWQISRETFETVLALYLRDQESFEHSSAAH